MCHPKLDCNSISMEVSLSCIGYGDIDKHVLHFLPKLIFKQKSFYF